MKNLYTYLLEARAVVGALPFSLDEFETFISKAIIDCEYDDAEIWSIIKEKFETKYPSKLWKFFTSLCEQYLELQNVSIAEFYASFENIPLARIESVLGAGSNGVALRIGKGKVLKLFYGDHIKRCDEPFIKYCYKVDSTVFPKVYKIGKNWCVMELLQTHTDKCKLYIDTLDKSTVNGKTLFSLLIDKKYKFDKINIEEFTDIQKEVFDWCHQVAQEMKDINSSYISFPGDLVLNNIGERANGEIVFFDV